ncbi:MAG: NUDIX hydrolase [Candidatus Omnitrophica bacterium]|nr:NUDIX hydrolase [Candidatus Omnitrophota bacterium]
MRNIIKRKKIFDGRLLKLCLERERLPNGHIVDLEVIRHPGAVLIVPILNREKVIMLKQYRPVINSEIWELPAGTLKKNEKPLVCAKRELVEETGFSAMKWKRLGFIYPAPGYTTEKITIYEARSIKKVEPKLQADEIIEPHILSKKAVRKLLKGGGIIDAKTICALALGGVI